MGVSEIISYSLIGLLLLGFLLFAWRDLSMLVRRPVKGMGLGLGRVWAVGRTTMIEAWAGRVWLLPVLWFVAVMVMIAVVRPFDETERFPLYIRILLTGQEWLVLVMLWVMACVSMPRDRERKIVVTNASKPLSRLEMLLGKMVGFSVIAFLLFMVMGLTSFGILKYEDYSIRQSAAKQYQLAETDYRLQAEGKVKGQAMPPPADKLRLAQEGSLFAYNYVTVRPGPNGMSIVGRMDADANGSSRWMKGGSMERAIYHFGRIEAPAAAIFAPTGSKPHFEFSYVVEPYVQPAPQHVQLNVSAQRVGAPGSHLLPQEMRTQEKTITLNSDGRGYWEPEQPDELFTPMAAPGKSVPAEFDLGDVEVTVSCPTPGVYLQMREGTTKNYEDFNVIAVPYNEAPDAIVPQPHPLMRGFEKRDMQEVSGPDKRELQRFGFAPLEIALFRFSGADLRNIQPDDKGNLTLSLALDTDKTDNYNRETEAQLIAYNEDARSQVFTSPVFSVIEKRVTQVTIPATLLGNPDPNKRGDLVIQLTCRTPGHSILLSDTSVRIDQPQSLFIVNLFKSEMVLFCEASLLVVICVTCSVRLGWPTAMLAAFTCGIFGFLAKFVADLQQSGGLAALNFTNFGERSASWNFWDHAVNAVWLTLGFLGSLIPDYTRFDSLAFITDLRNMPWPVVGLDMLWTLAYAIPLIALGYMLIRKQELG
jgi:hypothetical protein